METLASLALPLGIFLAGQDFCAEQTLRNRVLNAALDQAKVCIYVTNPRTDEILYMIRPCGKISTWKTRKEKSAGRFCRRVLNALRLLPHSASGKEQRQLSSLSLGRTQYPDRTTV